MTVDFLPPLYLSVIIPCYNEDKSLHECYRRISEACTPYIEKGYEIIFVNDGSKDHTWAIIEELHAKDKHVIGLCFSRNFGHGMALTAGLEACRGERVLIIDADLQDPPELLSHMMQKMDGGADVIYGKRIRRNGETSFKRITAHLFYLLLSHLSDVSIPRDTGDFRLINNKVVHALNSMPETARYIRGMIAWVGFTQTPIEYIRAERFAGRTHYTLTKMFKLAFDAITGFSDRPLRLAFYLSFIMILVSGFILIYILVSYFYYNAVHGWASMACIFVSSQAVQFFLLGVIGEYMGRTYQESKHRPKYIMLTSIGVKR